MDKSINQRFKKILEEKNITQTDFADKISTGRANVNNWCTFKNSIPLDTIVEFLKMYPDIDARWFLTGSPREYNVDHHVNVIEESKQPYADKDYIISLQKNVINMKENEIRRLEGEIETLSNVQREKAG